MYPTSGATIRGDINTKVEEAVSSDKQFIGLDVMPAVGVAVKSGTYPKISIADGELLTPGSTVRSRGGSYGEIVRKWGTDSYDTLDRGLEEAIDDVDVKDFRRFFNLEVTAARLVLRNVRLDHELRVAAATMNATTFGAGTNSAVAYTEANIATISFVADIIAAIERVMDKGATPNTIVMNSTVYGRIRRATAVQAWVAGALGAGAKVTADTIAASFADYGIESCKVGRQRYNSGKKGAAASMASVWGSTYIWVGAVNKGARMVEDVMSGGAGFTLVWNEEGGTFVTETYRDEKRRSNMVRVRQNTAEKVVDSTAGTLITTQYS